MFKHEGQGLFIEAVLSCEAIDKSTLCLIIVITKQTNKTYLINTKFSNRFTIEKYVIFRIVRCRFPECHLPERQFPE